MHLADQIALICVPLIAELAFEAKTSTIGVLVACQSIPHGIGSIPCGLLVDKSRSRRLAVGSTAVSAVGFLGAWVSVSVSNVVAFGVSIAFAGFGIVLFVLVVLSMIPAIADDGTVATANSRVEITRSVASFVVPLTVGVAITATNAHWFLAAAMTCAGLAMVVSVGFTDLEPAATEASAPLVRLREGWRFVIAEPRLRAIMLCSLAWNIAFAVLLVSMIPFLEAANFEAAMFGLAFASFGLAAVFGSWLAGALADRIPPRLVLVFGPGSSVIAVAIVLSARATQSSIAILGGFFLLGLGPSMWLVAQNTVRQLVTPRDTLGRVNAVIQTAIYGVRPIAAIAGGFVVGATSASTGLVVVIAGFSISAYAAVASGLKTIGDYSDLVPRIEADSLR